MDRIKKIGNIELDNLLFIQESFLPKHTKAVAFNTLGGGKIVYESVKRQNANNMTLDSKENGWLKEDTVKNIVLLADNLGVETEVVNTDNVSTQARFRLEEQPFIEYEPLFEGSEWYRVKIKMARV